MPRKQVTVPVRSNGSLTVCSLSDCSTASASNTKKFKTYNILNEKTKDQNVESKGMYTACACPYLIKVLIVKEQSYKNKGEKKNSFIAIF